MINAKVENEVAKGFTVKVDDEEVPLKDDGKTLTKEYAVDTVLSISISKENHKSEPEKQTLTVMKEGSNVVEFKLIPDKVDFHTYDQNFIYQHFIPG